MISSDAVDTVWRPEIGTTTALDPDGAIALGGNGRFVRLVDGAAEWSSPVPDVFFGRAWVVALAIG